MVVAHAAGYAVAFPSTAERGPHLDATGHGYWPLAVAAAVVAGGVALVLATAAGASGRSAGRRAWRGLAAWQAATFTCMEVGERAVAGGGGPVELAASPEFWLGIVLQVPVALLAARLLHTAERTGARVVAALGRGRRPAAARAAHAPAPVVRLVSLAGPSAARPRAPPLVVS